MIFIGLSFARPFLFQAAIKAVSEPDLSRAKTGGLLGATFLVFVLLAISRAYAQGLVNKSMAYFRGCIVAARLHKMYRLPQSELNKRAALTLSTTDIAGMERGVLLFHEVWAGILSTGLGIYILSRLAEAASFLVIIPVAIMLSVSYNLTTKMRPAQKAWNEQIERRVASTSDVLHGLRSAKMSGLTKAVASSLQAMMQKEVSSSKKWRKFITFQFVLSQLTQSWTSIVVLGATLFWTRSLSGSAPANIFATVSTTPLLNQPLEDVMMAFSKLTSAFACFERIQNYLLLPELVDVRQQDLGQIADANQAPRFAAQLVGVSTKPLDSGRQLFHSLHADFPTQELSVIIGPVGSGKSTILKLLLGEVDITRGHIHIDKTSIAYCDQKPWLENKSIKENIVGHRTITIGWYNKVLSACCLDRDIELLAKGDDTVVGSACCNLNGGQRQRVVKYFTTVGIY
ncbi:hypothetical protein VHEMI07576 [[Torrubiella] hemipterigena]|uniref:ABC transmembrane type-1 domain-containing protein n=1 Tax=[Torrubiella] hemipterigena TaxID=1531966 RepID=A0A0A1T3Y0_9HYPO|nr:hypothetical protein VHEMI07576 [[Torrubiella] hemipterigena]